MSCVNLYEQFVVCGCVCVGALVVFQVAVDGLAQDKRPFLNRTWHIDDLENFY